MNPLTIVRDLVYQARYTESLRLIYSSPDEVYHIARSYIKNHSGNRNPYRHSHWWDNGWGDDASVGGYGYSWGDGKDYRDGDGLGYGWNQGWCDKRCDGYFFGYGCSGGNNCPWRKNS